MADMKAAGLNPMLVSKVGGATSPSGAQAPVVNVGKDVGKELSQGVNSALAATRLKADLENIRADTSKKDAATAPKIRSSYGI